MDKLRACIYCRVSTDEERQLNALQKQIEENRNEVIRQGWELISEYIDEGKSGTKIKGRDEYQRLFEDMITDKFDIICIKDQDRLMRNTKDWYLFVDRLVQNHKRLYMYLENRWYTPDDALITGIKAIMAEEYSRNLSKKINNSHKRRIENAQNGSELTIIDNGLSFAYNYDKNNGFTIVEEQAAVVREIYRLCLAGYGARNIRRILTNSYPNIKNKQGNPLKEGSVLKILRNERYKGTIVANKTHYDFETKQTIHNPKSEWVYFEDKIPAIISKEEWEQVQKVLDGRQLADPENHRGQNMGKSPLSGKMFCGECGNKYWRRSNADGTVWSCSTYVKEGRKTRKHKNHKDIGLRDLSKGCDSSNISQREIMEIIEAIGNELSINREQVKRDMLEWFNFLLSKVRGAKGLVAIQSEISKLDNRKSKLLDSLLDECISKKEFENKKDELELRLHDLKVKEKELSNQTQDAKDIQKVIDNIDTELDTYIGETNLQEDRIKFVFDNLSQITVFEGKVEVDIKFMKKPIAVKRGLQYVNCAENHHHTG